MNALTPKPKAIPDYGPHPFSQIFPPMEDKALTALGEDIKNNGLRERIWLHEDHILEGNSRYRACVKIGHRFKEDDFRVFDPKTQGDPLAFVVSANLIRRHLNETQRAAIAATLVTTKLGYNQHRAAGVTNEQAAKLLGVSEATVKMAKQVAAKAAPEIAESVRKGDLRLNAAKSLLKFPKDQQVAELAKVRAAAAAAEVEKAQAKAASSSRGAKDVKPKSEAEVMMAALDDFSTKWRGFEDMQRRAFVTNFETELATLLDNIRQQRALTIGAAA
jgi:hypothetical protein